MKKLNRLNEHYEKLLIDYFSSIEIKVTFNSIILESSYAPFEKVHSICSNLKDIYNFNHIETLLIYGKNKNVPINVLKIVDDFQSDFKETYFIDVIPEYEYLKFSLFHKEYEYKVFEFKQNSFNDSEIIDKLNEFKYKEIKLPSFVISQIKEDLLRHFLKGYDINFEKYEFDIVQASKQKGDLMAIFTNIESGKQIIIHPLELSEQSGDVFFAGKSDNFLRL